MTRLSELIETKGTTIRQLAVDAEVPERSVYRHVRGVTLPNLSQAAAYAKALGVRLEDLLEPEA